MNRVTLYIFTISHYCEKARWALEYLGFDVDIKPLAPGTHAKVAQELGLKRGSLPYLQAGDTIVQGSDAIIDWAEEHSTSEKTLGSSNTAIIDVERRLDQSLGVHIRRWFYSEAILETPELVKPIFMHNLSVWEKAKLTIKWPVIQKLMIQRMDLGYDQGIESLEVVRQEMRWLDELLGGKESDKDSDKDSGKDSYLVDDQFSRADITAASLLAPIIMPLEHSCSALMQHPPRVEEVRLTMINEPLCQWVEEKYRNHRL